MKQVRILKCHHTKMKTVERSSCPAGLTPWLTHFSLFSVHCVMFDNRVESFNAATLTAFTSL